MKFHVIVKRFCYFRTNLSHFQDFKSFRILSNDFKKSGKHKSQGNILPFSGCISAINVKRKDCEMNGNVLI